MWVHVFSSTQCDSDFLKQPSEVFLVVEECLSKPVLKDLNGSFWQLFQKKRSRMIKLIFKLSKYQKQIKINSWLGVSEGRLDYICLPGGFALQTSFLK